MKWKEEKIIPRIEECLGCTHTSEQKYHTITYVEWYRNMDINGLGELEQEFIEFIIRISKRKGYESNAQLQQEAGFSANIITRLKRGGDISPESVESIGRVLNCGVDDILEFIPEDNGGRENGGYQKGTGA